MTPIIPPLPIADAPVLSDGGAATTEATVIPGRFEAMLDAMTAAGAWRQAQRHHPDTTLGSSDIFVPMPLSAAASLPLKGPWLPSAPATSVDPAPGEVAPTDFPRNAPVPKQPGAPASLWAPHAGEHHAKLAPVSVNLSDTEGPGPVKTSGPGPLPGADAGPPEPLGVRAKAGTLTVSDTGGGDVVRDVEDRLPAAELRSDLAGPSGTISPESPAPKASLPANGTNVATRRIDPAVVGAPEIRADRNGPETPPAAVPPFGGDGSHQKGPAQATVLAEIGVRVQVTTKTMVQAGPVDQSQHTPPDPASTAPRTAAEMRASTGTPPNPAILRSTPNTQSGVTTDNSNGARPSTGLVPIEAEVRLPAPPAAPAASEKDPPDRSPSLDRPSSPSVRMSGEGAQSARHMADASIPRSAIVQRDSPDVAEPLPGRQQPPAGAAPPAPRVAGIPPLTPRTVRQAEVLGTERKENILTPGEVREADVPATKPAGRIAPPPPVPGTGDRPGMPFDQPAANIEATLRTADTLPSKDMIAEAMPAEPRAGELSSRPELLLSRTPEAAPRHVIQQILDQVQFRSGAVDVTMTPEELGRVTLSLALQDGAVHITIAADRADTLDLIRRHSDLLMQEARSAGYSSVSFGFSDQAPNGNHGPEHGSDIVPGDPAPPDPVVERSPADSMHALGGLDIRL